MFDVGVDNAYTSSVVGNVVKFMVINVDSFNPINAYMNGFIHAYVVLILHS